MLGSYSHPDGYAAVSITGDWLNSIYKGGEEQRQQQIIHVRGIGGQIWAFDQNRPGAKKLRVGKGERPAGALLLAGNEWNQCPYAGFVQVQKAIRS